MNDDTQDHDATDTLVATAFARRAAAATLPAPDLEHLRALARSRPATAGRRVPLAVRGIAAAGAAAVLAAGVYAVQAGQVPAGTPSATSAARVPGAVDLSGGAPVVLRRIADVAATAPVTVPRPDQFVYTKLVGEGVPKGSPDGTLQRLGSEIWTAQSPGTDSLAIHDDGVPVPISHELQNDPGKLSEMPTYADLAALPTDPAALRAYLGAQFADPFGGAALLLQGNLVPPALAAALYRVLADEPGLTVVTGVVDAAGRPGIAVVRPDRTGTRHELVFDPDRLGLIGAREIDANGRPTSSVAFVAQSVVDDAGQRPA